MPTITLSVPDELKKKMDSNKEINWSEVARMAIREKIGQIQMLHELIYGIKTGDDLQLKKKINETKHTKYKEEHHYPGMG